MKPLAVLVLVALVAWLAWSELRPGPAPVPDCIPALVDSLRAARSARETAEAEAERAWRAHADSLASWEAQRAGLARRVSDARESGQRATAALRATATEQQGALIDSIETAHAEEVAGLEAEVGVWQSRALSAEAGWADARLAVERFGAEVVALRSVIQAQGALNDAIGRERDRWKREARISQAVGAAGWLLAAIK